MSVTCVPNVGQSGNQLFPTILANIVARKYNLNTELYKNKLVTFKKQKCDTPLTDQDSLQTRNPFQLNNKQIINGIHLLKDYYQYEEFFNPYRTEIKNDILDLPRVDKNCKDVVIHLRLDGFNHHGWDSHIIHPDWYTSILDSLSFDKLYIVMATKSGRLRKDQNKSEYIELFKKYNYEIVSGNEVEDITFIRSFDRIISSNSTFSWWACFLSDATHIFLPVHWEGKKSRLHTIGTTSKVVSHNFKYINIDNMQTVPISYNN